MKRFINDPGAVVREAVDGAVMAAGDTALCRIDDPDMAVVLRADWHRSHVALVAGGGSGHEPAHAGFVGQGMLTAAVCGQVFASPSAGAVLSAILAVTGKAGCLLIVKNYTGDRLNFGLAAERARAMGLLVEMVIVGDDIALPAYVQPRGIAGTLFVHKLAGAAASSGADLAQVASVARDAASVVRSVGVSLSTCHHYASEASERVGPSEAEVGLGIHGEPGAMVVPMVPARALMRQATQLLIQVRHRPDARYAALLNNLGAVPPIEMAVLTEALSSTPLSAQIDFIVGPGSFMTSLDMNGFSLSLLELDPAREAMLLARVAPVAWMPAQRFAPPRLVAAPVLARAAAAASGEPHVSALVQAGASLFGEIAADINALDRKIGDGDTGSTLAQAAAGVIERLDTLPFAETDKLLTTIGELLLRRSGGASGVLLATLFIAAGNACAAGSGCVAACIAGLDRTKAYGGASAGDRTLIDALEPALLRLSAGGSLPEAAAAARAGAHATSGMAARVGRASTVPEAKLAGVVDPGAEAVARLFERLAEVQSD